MINELQSSNKVILQGEVADELVFSHEIYGESFYEFNLKVKRLSDTYDLIPVTISNRIMQDVDLYPGVTFSFEGQFRSYNKLIDGKSKLMLTVFVLQVLNDQEIMWPNEIELTGYICKEPIYRVTPFKREICDLLLAVNRSYNKSDYLPCIAWGRNARYVRNFAIGDKITVVGRIQSREYSKKLDDGEVVTKVAFEVSLSKITADKENEYHDYFQDSEVITG